MMCNSHVITNCNKCVICRISTTKHNVLTHILHLCKYVCSIYVRKSFSYRYARMEDSFASIVAA